MSVGGATAVALAPEALLATADAALYRAKREGRNQSSVVAVAGMRRW